MGRRPRQVVAERVHRDLEREEGQGQREERSDSEVNGPHAARALQDSSQRAGVAPGAELQPPRIGWQARS